MRGFSLLFLVISVVVLLMFVVYVLSGSPDPLVAAGLFVSFLACAVPAVLLLRPFENREALERRRKAYRERREAGRSGDPEGDPENRRL